MRTVTVRNIKIGGRNPMVLIAGPCVIEDEKTMMRHAKRLKEITSRLRIPFIFKSSYDKANRTSAKSFRGPGLEKGMEILKRIKDRFDIPVTSDVHSIEEIEIAAPFLDVIQIPAFLSRQTDLITAAARTGRVVNIKKGQFLSPWDIKYAIEKVESAGNANVLITERGVSFGYNNLVSDFRSIVIMRDFNVPIIFDATHSVQLPGAAGGKSGGERRFVHPLILAAASVGADGIFIEAHEDPDNAPCDGPSMLTLKELPKVLKEMRGIERITRGVKL